MNHLEKHMLNILYELKDKYNVIGVKAEFESEGCRIEEVIKLKDLALKADLDLTIKIGGCEAIKDMHDAKTLNAKKIVAPMIETPYAFKKYLNAIKKVFPKNLYSDINFAINIETITGFNNLNEILKEDYQEYINDIVLGRLDMAGSLGLSRDQVNCDKIFNIAENMCSMCLKNNLSLTVGGSVTLESIEFFKKLNNKVLKSFETRKIIFDAQGAINNPNCNVGILKALDFELLYLENKQNLYGFIYNEDQKRIDMLKSINKMLLY